MTADRLYAILFSWEFLSAIALILVLNITVLVKGWRREPEATGNTLGDCRERPFCVSGWDLT